jgi:hypothetical protein
MIDDSHNEVHSREVVHHYLQINQSLENKKMHQCAILGSMLHDMMDRKYVSEEQGLKDIIAFLSKEKVDEKIIHALHEFLPTISYSKTVHQNHDGTLILAIPERIKRHPYYRCYEAIRTSDLIASYNLQRTLLYDLKKGDHRHSSIMDMYDHARSLYESRMDRLIQDNIIPENAHSYASSLHEKSRKILFGLEIHKDMSFQEMHDRCFVYTIPEWTELVEKI